MRNHGIWLFSMKILFIGGNRYFGKKTVKHLLAKGHELTLLNRQSLEDGFGAAVQRIKCDRKDFAKLKSLTAKQNWDLVFDQVCYEASEARAACEIFQDRANRYIFTSSQSVYGPGGPILEQDFDPYQFRFQKDVPSTANYPEAKRQCESIFFSQNTFAVTAIRFPIVVGPDDYTGRFHWHVDRIKKGQSIFLPNLRAKLSLIHSDDAARILSEIAEKNTVGAFNACSKEPIELATLVHGIEKALGKEAVLASAADKENQSPYGINSDWYMSAEKLSAEGFVARHITDWLRELIQQLI